MIFNIFKSPEINITVNPNSITFSHKTAELILECYLYFQVMNGMPMVLAISETPEDVEKFSEVKRHDLFKKSSHGDEDKFDLLSSFFRFGFKKLNCASLFVHPIVSVSNIDSL